MRILSRVIIITIFLFLSCKKEEQNFQSKLKVETSKVFKQALLPQLQNNIKHLKTDLKISEIPLELYNDTLLKRYRLRNKSALVFTKQEIDSSRYYALNNWKQIELDTTILVGSLTLDHFEVLLKKMYKLDTLIPTQKNEELERFRKEFDSLWKDKFNEGYYQISSPIFNSNFSKCFLLVYFEANEPCGFPGNVPYQFIKTNNTWVVDTKN